MLNTTRNHEHQKTKQSHSPRFYPVNRDLMSKTTHPLLEIFDEFLRFSGNPQVATQFNVLIQPNLPLLSLRAELRCAACRSDPMPTQWL